MSQHVSTAPAGNRRRAATIALWVLQVITAIAMLGAGWSTISGAPQAMAIFDALGTGDWFRYLTGALEVAGGLGLLIPRLAGLAALALAMLWLVALGTHLFLVGGNPAAAVVFFILTAVIAWARQDHIRTLLPNR